MLLAMVLELFAVIVHSLYTLVCTYIMIICLFFTCIRLGYNYIII